MQFLQTKLLQSKNTKSNNFEIFVLNSFYSFQRNWSIKSYHRHARCVNYYTQSKYSDENDNLLFNIR